MTLAKVAGCCFHLFVDRASSTVHVFPLCGTICGGVYLAAFLYNQWRCTVAWVGPCSPACWLGCCQQVVVTPATQEAAAAARQAGRSTWRVSSTLFTHLNSDTVLQPLGHFALLPGALERYPPRRAGEQVSPPGLPWRVGSLKMQQTLDYLWASTSGCRPAC